MNIYQYHKEIVEILQYQNKLKRIKIGDPILQNGQQYIPKEKSIHQFSKNYFQRE